jgi:hypothetical protein
MAAVKTGALLLANLFYRQLALSAGHAGAAVDIEGLLEIAGLAILSGEIAQRSTTLLDGPGQHVPDALRQ